MKYMDITFYEGQFYFVVNKILQEKKNYENFKQIFNHIKVDPDLWKKTSPQILANNFSSNLSPITMRHNPGSKEMVEQINKYRHNTNVSYWNCLRRSIQSNFKLKSTLFNNFFYAELVFIY